MSNGLQTVTPREHWSSLRPGVLVGEFSPKPLQLLTLLGHTLSACLACVLPQLYSNFAHLCSDFGWGEEEC